MPGVAAGSFGLLALFARALGGFCSDRVARSFGLDGRTMLLFGLLLGEGFGLLAFSRMDTIAPAITAMLAFGLFTHMACGAIYALVPFIDRTALGGVAGIIGAGGNVGAVAAVFLQKSLGSVEGTLFYLGFSVIVGAVLVATVRFSLSHKEAEQTLFDEAVARRAAIAGGVAAMA